MFSGNSIIYSEFKQQLTVCLVIILSEFCLMYISLEKTVIQILKKVLKLFKGKHEIIESILYLEVAW